MYALNQKIESVVTFLRTRTIGIPKVGIILGSGLGYLADNLEDRVNVHFHEIPDSLLSTIEGHKGTFAFGNFEGVPVVVLDGRLHYYEGYSQQELALPVYVMRKMGVETLILTNAAGGINLDFSAGTLMLITDHINYSGVNPLIGPNLDDFGLRFPDASDIYTKELRNKLKETALHTGIELSEGVYIMYSGPNYETPAEIRFFREIGADAAGMSTVPEALVAAHCRMKVIGISCITNMAAGVLDKKLDHQEVLEIANKIKPQFTKLLNIAVKLIDTQVTM